MKGYRFEDGKLDRRPLGLEDIPNISLPYGGTYFENNIDFLVVRFGIGRGGNIGPDPLTSNFYLTSFHLYGTSISEFMNGVSQRRMNIRLFPGGTSNYIFYFVLVAGEYNALNIGGVLWTFGWNYHFPEPVLFSSGQTMRFAITHYGTGDTAFFPAIAGFYE